MLNDLEQITIDRTLTASELQRYIFRLVEDLNFRISSVESTAADIDVAKILDAIPTAQKGKDGQSLYTWIKYSPNSDGSNMTNLPQSDTKYIGISYNNTTASESSDPTDYTWSEYVGPQGQTGPQGVGVVSIGNQYVYSDSPTTLPSSPAWSTTVPTYDPTKYLWIRQEITYSNGNTTYTTPIHDAEMDDAMSRLSSAEETITQTSLTINGIEITVEGNSQDITNLVSRIEGAEDALDSVSGGLTDLTSDVSGLTLTINGIEVSIDDIVARLQELRNLNAQLTADIAQRTAELNNIISSFNSYIAEEGQYMRYGDQGLELGAEGSQFKTVIDNQRMAFMDGATTTAYVSGQLFNMNNAVVRGTLKKGGYEEQVKADGSVYIVWVGV